MAGIVERPERLAPVPAQFASVALFATTAWMSATLIFTIEPMVARLVLPLLGGSAAVWNTSLAFFQIALLAGYFYAHLLQHIRRIGIQVIIHLIVLIVAGISLPLHVTALLGEPSPTRPILWLLSVLAISVGGPFMALSATAPLIQAWHARAMRDIGAREPYFLYAASNLGSLIALLAYPIVIEPNLSLHSQAMMWSAAYGAFLLLLAYLGMAVWRTVQPISGAKLSLSLASQSGSWKEKLIWLALAAVPSSLMLGVTNFITTDLGSAPFLWVVPLALYLGTFILAFHDRQIIRPQLTLRLQAPVLLLCGLVFWLPAFLPELAIHLLCFFLTALVCHQALVARRPPASRLTDFYIWMSLGGVLGGVFNAFIAPQIFNTVVEYPAVLVLSCLALPWGHGPFSKRQWIVSATSVVVALAASWLAPHGSQAQTQAAWISFALLCVTAICAYWLRQRAILFAAAVFALVTAGASAFGQQDMTQNWRDFFGVLSFSHRQVGGLGDVNLLQHGTTLHGAQSFLPTIRCRPLVYYAPETPIGQVFEGVQSKKDKINIGAVGLGAGAVAAYTRGNDILRFFEIDPLVVRVATDPRYFTYTTACAHGHIGYTLGDARLTLAGQADGQYDILLIDAFSSDTVPAHLLTVEAMRIYLSKLKPDGILILHLSNRHLDLMRPTMAAVSRAGAYALQQTYRPPQNLAASREQAVIAAKSREALEPFRSSVRWSKADAEGVAPWTDDYTNVFGALVRATVKNR